MKTIEKSATGITGFDEMTGGGLPRGRTTLVTGGAGAGKTLLSLQFLVHGATARDECGIFVAFEETAERIVANSGGFGWNVAGLRGQRLCFIDAQPSPDLVESGSFDLEALLAVLAAQVERSGATRIVFDALDVLLALLPDERSRRREVHRLHAWLSALELTAIITAKAGDAPPGARDASSLAYVQYMVDCAVILHHDVVQGVSQRTLRVQKFRGSAFDENESPYVIGKQGIEIGVARSVNREQRKVNQERISSGVASLDAALGGGFLRGASVLLTGPAGSAKTTLSAAFARAACERGERTAFVSFDTDSGEVVRNMASVGIELGPHIDSGNLLLISARSFIGSAGAHLVRIKLLAQEHGARCLVIDPVSTWVATGDGMSAHSVAEQLIDWAKSEDITLVNTSLHNQPHGDLNLHISTLADTWIQLDYPELNGERTRRLSIIKSRGTAHSRHRHELLLSREGPRLADVRAAALDTAGDAPDAARPGSST